MDRGLELLDLRRAMDRGGILDECRVVGPQRRQESLAFRLDTAAAVDATYEKLTSAGHLGHKAP